MHLGDVEADVAPRVVAQQPDDLPQVEPGRLREATGGIGDDQDLYAAAEQLAQIEYRLGREPPLDPIVQCARKVVVGHVASPMFLPSAPAKPVLGRFDKDERCCPSRLRMHGRRQRDVSAA